ncbi:hypothetical protein Tco_0385328 [Tanacetum coccineum]
MLLQLTRGHVPLAGVNEQGNQNEDVQGDGVHVDEVPTVVAEKPKVQRKRKTSDGANGSSHPPKKLREDHGTSGHVGARTGGKSLARIQELFEQSTLNMEVGVTAAATVPFVTSSTQCPSERFVISSDSSHDSSANVADDEVTLIVRYSVPSPPLMIVAIATTVMASVISASVSRPSGVKTSTDTFLVFRSIVDQLTPPRSKHNYTVRKKFERRCARLIDLLREKDVEVANLKAHLSLKEAEAAKAIRLRGQIATLSCDELNIKAASLETEKDKLIDQVSTLEGTCYGLYDKVMGYKLFKEQIEVVQDEQVKVLSDKRWILSRGLRLVVMKCLQSLKYLAALGGAIGRAIDNGMQDGLAASIDHGKAGQGLAKVVAYIPIAEANYVFVVNAICAMDFPLLAQLASHKDAIMSDLMDLLLLEGPTAKTIEAKQLQPSPEQLMLPIHHPQDQVFIKETSLSFSLDVIHAYVQRIQGDAVARRLSLFDVMVPLIEPPSAENLIGEVSTSKVLTMATITALSTTFIQTSSIVRFIKSADYVV